MVFIRKFPSLKILDLSYNKITGKGVQELAECEFNLQSLSLSANRIGDELKFLHKFKALEELSLGGVGLTVKGV